MTDSKDERYAIEHRQSIAGTPHELKPGESRTVPPNTPHRVAGANDGRRRFAIVQGIGTYDRIPA